MNKKQFIGVIRHVVKEEIKNLMTTSEGRAMIKEMISKEVRKEVDKLLTEMEESQSQNEVIQESREDVKISSMVSRNELPPKHTIRASAPVESPVFTKNQKLNKMLNQTFESIVRGDATLPSREGADGQLAMMKEAYAGQPTGGTDDYPTMPMGGMTSSNARTFGMMRPPQRPGETTGKSVAQMLPDKDVNGNHMMVNPNALPDHIQRALTRDYRKLMKKVDNGQV